MSATAPPQLAALLERLERAEPRPQPAPPRMRALSLLALAELLRLGALVLPPLLALVLILAPFLWRRLIGEAAPGAVGEFTWLAALWLALAWWRAIWRRAPGELDGLALRPEDHPRLFELVRAAARAARAPMPDELRVDALQSFGVHEEPRGPLGSRRRRVLWLDAFDLEQLELVELGAILLHELAHLGGGHARLSLALWLRARFLRALRAELARSSWRVVNPIYLLLVGGEALYERGYAALSRRHELQSDALAIELLGPGPFADSLRKAARSSLRVGEHLDEHLAAAMAGGPEDVIAAIAAREPDAAEAARLERWEAARMAEASAALDSHPSHGERVAQAERLASARPELARLEGLRGGPRAYDVLLVGGHAALARRASKRLVERERAFRLGEIGLRGDLSIPVGERRLPALRVRVVPTAAWLLALVALVGALLVFGLAIVVAEGIAEEPEPTTFLLRLELALLVALAALVRARRMRVTTDARGLVRHGLLGRESMPWAAVRALRWDARRVELRGKGDEGARRFVARGEGRDVLAELALELAPRLTAVGWSVGLARVPRPAPEELRAEAWEDSEGLHLRTPEGTRIDLESRHPRHAAVRAGLEHRLLPALLERERAGAGAIA